MASIWEYICFNMRGILWTKGKIQWPKILTKIYLIKLNISYKCPELFNLSKAIFSKVKKKKKQDNDDGSCG